MGAALGVAIFAAAMFMAGSIHRQMQQQEEDRG